MTEQSTMNENDMYDEEVEWATGVISSLTDEQVRALDVLGWKIVCKDDPDRRWPFGSSDHDSPDWCENLAAMPEDKRMVRTVLAQNTRYFGHRKEDDTFFPKSRAR